MKAARAVGCPASRIRRHLEQSGLQLGGRVALFTRLALRLIELIAAAAESLVVPLPIFLGPRLLRALTPQFVHHGHWAYLATLTVVGCLLAAIIVSQTWLSSSGLLTAMLILSSVLSGPLAVASAFTGLSVAFAMWAILLLAAACAAGARQQMGGGRALSALGWIALLALVAGMTAGVLLFPMGGEIFALLWLTTVLASAALGIKRLVSRQPMHPRQAAGYSS